ncbi:hypothetical protein SVAN01_08846 [Stagonosporopsis vannaccii]|nr:hypothetical protein SVAN01_08846 [Stagonosporopsis vannaccii]
MQPPSNRGLVLDPPESCLQSAARRAAVACSELDGRQQGHCDTPTAAQHTGSLGFDARIAAASRHQSTAVQQAMRQPGKRTRAVCGGSASNQSSCRSRLALLRDVVKPAKAYDVSSRARVHGRRSIAFAGSVFVCAMTHPACAVDDLATPAAQLWNSKSLFDLLPAALLARQPYQSQQPLSAARERRKSPVRSVSDICVVTGCSTAAAQVMVRFKCAVDASIQGLHAPVGNGLGMVFPTRTQRSCRCQITAFTAGCLSSLAHADPLHSRSHPGYLSARSSTLLNVIDMPVLHIFKL